MTQRVNIQYSIELQDLPAEVSRIYDTAVQQLQNISLEQENETELLDATTLKNIDETRKKLATLDHVLNDLSGIIGSFVEYEISQLNSSNNQTGPTDVEDPVTMPE
jgi:hypothetical protein